MGGSTRGGRSLLQWMGSVRSLLSDLKGFIIEHDTTDDGIVGPR